MRVPPDYRRKRKPATVDRGGLQNLGSQGRQTDGLEYNEAVPLNQAKPPASPIVCPVAFARRFGWFFAVFVRERGIEERLGLYGDAGAAIAAAADLNAIFAESAT